MATKKITKKTGTNGNAKASKPAPAKRRAKKKLTPAERKGRTASQKSEAKAPKKLSLIGAAAQVLGKSKEPMTCKDMVNEVIAAGLWTPGSGKTPHATLYSAILRDLKSETPRFEKVDRGQFTLAPGMKKGA
jgi:hypothetical protein